MQEQDDQEIDEHGEEPHADEPEEEAESPWRGRGCAPPHHGGGGQCHHGPPFRGWGLKPYPGGPWKGKMGMPFGPWGPMPERLETKEEALDFIHGIRFAISRHLDRMRKGVEHLEKKKSRFDDIIARIEQMEPYDADAVKALIDEKPEDSG